MTNKTIARVLKLGLGPFLFLLILILPGGSDLGPAAKRTLAVTALMGAWWMTEALPLPVTALVPLVLFPFLRILPSKIVAQAYISNTIFLFMGGFFIAAALERWKLHERISLHTIRLIGRSPRRIVLGFMVATAFMSMWISNTATALMMLPVGIAISRRVGEMLEGGDEQASTASLNMGVALMLGIAYGASIGGVGTLVGTPPNIIFVAAFERMFPEAPDIDFAHWMLFGLVFVTVFLPIAWWVLVRWVSPIPRGLTLDRDYLNERVRALPPMKFPEKFTLFIFALTAAGWIFRKDIAFDGFLIPGWSTALGIEAYAHDATVAILAALLLFITPADLSFRDSVLDWEHARRIPWGILILFGGGLALAQAVGDSGLAEWFGGHLKLLEQVPAFFMVMAISFLLTFLTEITSNTATTTLFMPILAAVGVGLRINPLLLMIPATVSASCAFMLPAATPPNAVVFGSGMVSMSDMVRAGIRMNLIGVVIVSVLVWVLGRWIFGIDMGEFPAWAK